MFQIKNNKQAGNALIIVVVILVVLVLGSLSYIYFFMGKSTDIAQKEEDDDSLVVDDNDNDESGSTPVEPTEEPTDDEPDDSSTAVNLNTKTGKENVKITQWDLIGYYNGKYNFNYYISNSTSGSKLLEFSSTSLTGSCEEAVVGSIMRLSADMEEADIFPSRKPTSKTISQAYPNNTITEWTGNWHIGDYYYVYIAPQTACYQTGSTTPDKIFSQVSIDVKNYFDSLVAE